jgi:DNA-binding MarR family transcriptional regulator
MRQEGMATGHDIPMGLRAAYLAMHRQTSSALARHEVTADQFVLLSLLSERDGITQQDLVRRASSDANTVRAMLVRLEERGLVGRSPHRTDGRARSVTLTAKGRRTFAKLWRESEPVRGQMAAVFRPEEADLLVEFLSRVARTMAPGRLGTPRNPVKGDKR